MAKKYKEKEDTKRPQPVARDGSYVMMLFISLVAIVAGSVFMYLDNEEYGGKSPQKEAPPTIQKLGAEFKDSGTGAPGPAPGPGPAPVPGPAPMPMGM